MRDRRWVAAVAVCAAIGLFVLAFYLSVYAVRGYDQPLGYDTARYLWRTNCVANGGLSQLRRCAAAPAALPSRPGYPMVTLLLSAITRVPRHQLAAVVPPLAACAIALAGAAMVSWALGPDPKRFAVVGIVIGVSPMLIALANPEAYADTMMACAIGMAGLLAAMVVAEGGRGIVAASALLAAAAVVHSATGVVMAAVIVGVVLSYLPAALVALRSGASVRRTPMVRLSFVLGGALAVWAAVLAGVVRARPDSYRVLAANLEEKLRSHWPRLGFPVGVPAAAVGAVALVRGRVPAVDNGRRRMLLSVLLAWVGVVTLALVLWFAGWKLPIHRFLLLALAIPILGAIALLWLGDRAGRGRPGRGVIVLVAGCVAVAGAGYLLWIHNAPPILRSPRLDAASAATEYIKGLPPGLPVDVVTDAHGVNPDALAQSFRVVLPANDIAEVRFPARAILDDPSRVVLLVKEYSQDFARQSAASPDRRVGSSILVLSGPMPNHQLAAPRGPRLDAGFPTLVGVGMLSLLLLGALGLGWGSLAFPTLGWLERVAVAPAVGLTILVVDGLILDLVGARIGGLPGVVMIVATGVLGAVLGLRPTSQTPSNMDVRDRPD